VVAVKFVLDHRRYVTLDALRGVAALAVVVFHIPEMFGLPHQESSSLAVDLFFILSGFVIEHAYGDQLRREMSFAKFIKVRMIRLYPLYIVGLVAYVLFFIARPNVTAGRVIPAAFLALFYVPTPPAISFEPQFLFPVNPVSWSLFCELLVNILYALYIVRWSVRSLFWLTIVFAVMLFAEKVLQENIDTLGPWSILIEGTARALFSFFAGVLLYRLAPHRFFAGSALAILILIGIFRLNFDKHWQHAYELLIILIGFPLLVLFASRTRPAAWLAKIYDTLGTISYPTYVIHMPIVLWTSALYPRLFGKGLATIAPWGGFALISLIAFVAYLLDRLYDQPVRRWLRHRRTPGSQLVAWLSSRRWPRPHQ
jgi:peptidoglycan/LPS O-acetylase OafA/YrhL